MDINMLWRSIGFLELNLLELVRACKINTGLNMYFLGITFLLNLTLFCTYSILILSRKKNTCTGHLPGVCFRPLNTLDADFLPWPVLCRECSPEVPGVLVFTLHFVVYCFASFIASSADYVLYIM